MVLTRRLCRLCQDKVSSFPKQRFETELILGRRGAELRSLTRSSGSTLRRSGPDAANFTGGSRKFHRRIETEATPHTLFERKERNSRRELEDVEVFHCCLHLGFELEEEPSQLRLPRCRSMVLHGWRWIEAQTQLRKLRTFPSPKPCIGLPSNMSLVQYLMGLEEDVNPSPTSMSKTLSPIGPPTTETSEWCVDKLVLPGTNDWNVELI
ncbi:hypothetical protein YC2023_119672 [Brassica napus]